MTTQTEIKYALKRPAIYPGYISLVWAWVNAGVGYGAYMYSWGAFAAHLMRLKLVTPTEIGVTAALGRFEGGIEAAPAGYLIDRWGPRNMIVLGFFLAAVGYFLLSLWLIPNALWIYITYVGLVQLSMNFGLYNSSNKILQWYFIRTRGRWMALQTTGAAAGGTIMSPLIAAVIERANWQVAAQVTAAGLLVCAVVSWFTMRNKPPQAYGLLPDNEKLPSERTKEELEAARARGDTRVMTADDFLPDMGIRDAFKTRAFWGLLFGSAVGGWFAFAVPSFAFLHIGKLGFTPTEAGALAGLFLPFSVLGRVIVAVVADRTNPLMLYGLSYVGAAAGLFVLANAVWNPGVMIWAYAPIYGIPFGALPAVYGHAYAACFGRKWFATIQGVINGIITPITGFSALMMGIIIDVSGSTQAGLNFTALNILVGSLGFLVIATIPKPMKEARHKALAHGIRMAG